MIGKLTIDNHQIPRIRRVLWCLLVLAVGPCFAAPQVMVTPTRVVFDAKARSAQVTIINTGDAVGTFRISLANKRMTPEGTLQDAAEAQPGDQFASHLIRYSPRQVTLNPGQSQVVRLGLRRPSNLAAGEYRSHLLFQEVPHSQDNAVESATERQQGITVNLRAIIGISIPVIVRHGATQAQVAFKQASYRAKPADSDKPYIEMELERSGNQSVYGEFIAEYIPVSGDRRIVAQVGGVAIYTPGTRRLVKLGLNMMPDAPLGQGTLEIIYRQPVDQGGAVLAHTQIKLP